MTSTSKPEVKQPATATAGDTSVAATATPAATGAKANAATKSKVTTPATIKDEQGSTPFVSRRVWPD